MIMVLNTEFYNFVFLQFQLHADCRSIEWSLRWFYCSISDHVPPWNIMDVNVTRLLDFMNLAFYVNGLIRLLVLAVLKIFIFSETWQITFFFKKNSQEIFTYILYKDHINYKRRNILIYKLDNLNFLLQYFKWYLSMFV